MIPRHVQSVLAALACFTASVAAADPVRPAITYQGRLLDAGSPASGSYAMSFTLFDAAAGGNPIGATLTFDGLGGNPPLVNVTDGLFTVELDFGMDAFAHEARWLEIGVRGTPLVPRQKVTPAPLALALPGLFTQEPGPGLTPNVLGGASGNTVTAGVQGATIAGGGQIGFGHVVTDHFGTIGGGMNNRAGDAAASVSSSEFATVAGGDSNVAGDGYSVVGGGRLNLAEGFATTISGGEQNIASGIGATVGGGEDNSAGGDRATVGGGRDNLSSGSVSTISGGDNNAATGSRATIGGGDNNTAGGDRATVGGGGGNTAGGQYSTIGGGAANSTADADFATLAGGLSNTANGAFSSVSGGQNNSASGTHAAVAGGYNNAAAGPFSLAAGRRSKANHSGSFVWADATDVDFASSGDNQFLIRADGGVGIGTSEPTTALCVDPGGAGGIIVGGPDITAGGRTSLSLGVSTNSGGHSYLQSVGAAGESWGDMILNGDGGNVGIGLTEPTDRLHVNGGFRVESDANFGGAVNVGGPLQSFFTVKVRARPGDFSPFQVEQANGADIVTVVNQGLYVTGALFVSGQKNFIVDHPLDPANKSLAHNAIEAPGYYTMYHGRVTLNEAGEAWAALPDYFQALNGEWQYQLTCVGGYAAVYVAQEIADNRFLIAGGKPGLTVCWQVTGQRHDPFARDHPYQAEIDKDEVHRGRYYYPEGHGAPPEQGIRFAPSPAGAAAQKE